MFKKNVWNFEKKNDSIDTILTIGLTIDDQIEEYMISLMIISISIAPMTAFYCRYDFKFVCPCNRHRNSKKIKYFIDLSTFVSFK